MKTSLNIEYLSANRMFLFAASIPKYWETEKQILSVDAYNRLIEELEKHATNLGIIVTKNTNIPDITIFKAKFNDMEGFGESLEEAVCNVLKKMIYQFSTITL